ncbi:MAG: ACT domain-containing protein [Candidatus Atribacteria bacterium]|nr:ACT domain-containing protein [Candidatus Atribacteria bacterium]
MPDKVVITVVGKDRVGIIATVTSLLAAEQVNIEDITQKILGEFFTMILIGDTSRCSISLNELRARLLQKGEEIGVQIFMQHTSIFRAMHRI